MGRATNTGWRKDKPSLDLCEEGGWVDARAKVEEEADDEEVEEDLNIVGNERPNTAVLGSNEQSVDGGLAVGVEELQGVRKRSLTLWETGSSAETGRDKPLGFTNSSDGYSLRMVHALGPNYCRKC